MVAQGQSGARRSLTENASGCVPEASVHSYSRRGASNSASRDYSFIVDLSGCFRGEVRMSTATHHLIPVSGHQVPSVAVYGQDTCDCVSEMSALMHALKETRWHAGCS